MADIQYCITIMGGREVSRPHQNVGYRFEKFDAAFFQEIILSSGVFHRETASGFYPFGDATDLAGEGGVGDVVWLIQASA